MRLTPDTKLHSREHVLADDLAREMGEPKRFAAYLGIAKRYYESDLRALARRVLEKNDLPSDARGKYFFAVLRILPMTPEARKKSRAKKKKKAIKVPRRPRPEVLSGLSASRQSVHRSDSSRSGIKPLMRRRSDEVQASSHFAPR